jgi:hypothetical protein
VSEKKLGGVGDAARSQNHEPEFSTTTSKIAPSTARPRFTITFVPRPGVDAIRALRHLLKIAGRRLGLRAIDAYEQPGQISNQAADEFRELRDEVLAERAQAWSRGHE